MGEVEVQHGDIVLLGTDGLFDNMYTWEILDMVTVSLGQPAHMANLAKHIAVKAQKLAADPHRMSPFAQKAVDVGHRFTGGKPDDVTVIISTVIDVNSVQDELSGIIDAANAGGSTA